MIVSIPNTHISVVRTPGETRTALMTRAKAAAASAGKPAVVLVPTSFMGCAAFPVAVAYPNNTCTCNDTVVDRVGLE